MTLPTPRRQLVGTSRVDYKRPRKTCAEARGDSSNSSQSHIYVERLPNIARVNFPLGSRMRSIVNTSSPARSAVIAKEAGEKT